MTFLIKVFESFRQKQNARVIGKKSFGRQSNCISSSLKKSVSIIIALDTRVISLRQHSGCSISSKRLLNDVNIIYDSSFKSQYDKYR